MTERVHPYHADRSERAEIHRPGRTTVVAAKPGVRLGPNGTGGHGETIRRLARRFGQDFSRVRVHEGTVADAMAAQHGALAYADGEDIVLGAGVRRLPPLLVPGLLAHELAHVVQQRGGQSSEHREDGSPMLEHDADVAARTYMRGGVPRITARRGGTIAMLTVEEGERKVWGYVPGWAKDYLRPAAMQAKQAIEAVVDPKTELPKPVEQVIEAAAVVAPAPEPAPAPAAATADKKPPAAPKPTWKAAVAKAKADLLGKVRDSAMESVGTVKGVALEVGNLVDTVLWVSYEAHQLTESAVQLGAGALGLSDAQKKMVMDEFKALTPGYDAGMALASKYGLVSDTGAPAVSGAISTKFDTGADYLAKSVFADAAPEDPLVFSSYEIGELEGAVGSQVALAFVGVEEVQVGLKVVGAIGAIKNFVESVIRAGSSWYKNLDVIVGAINIALSILGLRQARAARKIINMVVAAGGLVNAVPPMAHLIKDWTDPELAKDPEKREKTLRADYSALVKAIAAIVQGIIQHGMAKKAAEPGPAGAAPEPPAAGRPAPPSVVAPTEPPTAGRPAPPSVVAPTEAPTTPSPTAAKSAATSIEPPTTASPTTAKPSSPAAPVTPLEPPGAIVRKVTGARPATPESSTPRGKTESSDPMAKRPSSASAAERPGRATPRSRSRARPSAETEPPVSDAVREMWETIGERRRMSTRGGLVDEAMQDLPPGKPRPSAMRRGEAMPGRGRVPESVKSSLRRMSREAFGRRMQEALRLQSGDELTTFTREFLRPDQELHILQTGELPPDFDHHHLLTVADFPEFAGRGDVGVGLPKGAHLEAGHGLDPTAPLEAGTLRDPGALERPAFGEDPEAQKRFRSRTRKRIAEGVAASTPAAGGLDADLLIEQRARLQSMRRELARRTVRRQSTDRLRQNITVLEEAIGVLEERIAASGSSNR